MANPYFNAAYYLANNQDLVIAGYTEANVEEHYDAFGAAEGRAPNSWFDAKAYLLANPDLINGGITLATALQHFANYGVYEGRIFNNNPALDPANFDAAGYAAQNADVAEAFGIENPAEVTPEQAAQLLSHFLVYGLREGREGAGKDFTDAAKAGSTIEVEQPTTSYVNVGTAGDDTFVWADANFNTANINGLAGHDTVKLQVDGARTLNVSAVEAIEVSKAVTDLTVNGAGVQSLVVTKDGSVTTYKGESLSSVTAKANLNTTFDFTKGVSGTSDALALDLAGANNTVKVNGVEQFKITAGEKVTSLTLQSDKLEGKALDITVSGGKADLVLELESVGSSNLESVTVDASGVAAKVEISKFGDLSKVNAVIKTGAGADTIDLSTGFKGQTVTVNAGAGADTIIASEGIDTLTGGAGADTFKFNGVANAAVKLTDKEVSAVNTITDYKQEDNAIEFTGLTKSGNVTGVGTVDDNGLLTFDTGFGLAGKKLHEVLKALSENVDPNAGVIFSFQNETYVFVGGTKDDDITNDGLIKLTGVKAADLAIDTGVIDFASDLLAV